jgi:hypothetical protein
MLSRVDQIASDCRFAQFLARFQPVQTFYQDEAIAIAPQQDRGLEAGLQDTLGDFIDSLGSERSATPCRDIDLFDRK